MDKRDVQEERTEQLIQVRRVRALYVAWTERERGAPGAFTLQLILDHGADEYILHPTAGGADMLLARWTRSESATFDLVRKVLIFS